MQSKLEEESAEHGDILQETFQDSYNNLTIKSIFILKYYVGVADNLGNKFLLKTDDDSFVHLEALWDLAKSRMTQKSNNLIGYLQVCEIYIWVWFTVATYLKEIPSAELKKHSNRDMGY